MTAGIYSARKLLLPHLVVTEVVTETDVGAVKIEIPAGAHTDGGAYYMRPKNVAGECECRDGKPRSVEHRFNLFPVVLDCDGAPWAEANVYILSRLGDTAFPSMATFANIAEDLAAYRRFLDEAQIDWMLFPSQKLNRPTYRYNGYLKIAVGAGEIAAATAKRRMSAVIAFYKWLRDEDALVPENPPWKESDRYVHFIDAQGFKMSKSVSTTDISIHVPRQNDPYDGTIDDGAKLRPLPKNEQEWLVTALVSLGNTEMTLIHLFGMLTGARIQTILTFRVRHALLDIDVSHQGEVRFPVGPGTAIDTKHDKQLVLHIPVWFYRMLRIYALSDRARRRRLSAFGGDNENQYLFLSTRGAPFYRSKEDARTFDAGSELRHQKSGQSVRQFMTERVIPFIRHKYGAKSFRYQFHDTRATAGMNWTDHQLKLVEQGEITLHEAREFVKIRMGHESAAVTDRYLQYRRNLKMVRWIGMQHESHLMKLAAQAMEGVS